MTSGRRPVHLNGEDGRHATGPTLSQSPPAVIGDGNGAIGHRLGLPREQIAAKIKNSLAMRATAKENPCHITAPTCRPQGKGAAHELSAHKAA